MKHLKFLTSSSENDKNEDDEDEDDYESGNEMKLKKL